MKLKQSSYKNGRGYSGWHKNNYGKYVYCRSLLEKIYCLILDEYNKNYEMENQTYLIDGHWYKPDFFIYDKKGYKLERIVEIKGTKKEKELYLYKFSNFFKSNGINYDVVVIDKRKYLKKWNLELDEFKSKSNAYIQRGSLNPMFGMHHNSGTKEKIKEKTSDRWKDPVEREKMINGTRNAMLKREVKEKISKSKKRYHIRKRRKELMSLIYIKGGYIEKECYICGRLFLDRVYNNRYHCFSNSCIQKNSSKNFFKKKIWNEEEKTKRFETTLIKIAYKNFNIDDINASNFDSIRKEKLYNKSPLSMKSITKYFGDIDNFKRRVKEWQKSNE